MYLCLIVINSGEDLREFKVPMEPSVLHKGAWNPLEYSGPQEKKEQKCLIGPIKIKKNINDEQILLPSVWNIY